MDGIKRGARSLGIRTKLIVIFVAIKVVPLLVLAIFAWRGQEWLAERVSESLVRMTGTMRETVEVVANSITRASIRALDDGARESLERLTTDTAKAVAVFLYDRDQDVRQAALMAPDQGEYRRFLAQRNRLLENHHQWVLSPDGTRWIPGEDATPRYDLPPVQPSIEDNRRNFFYRQPDQVGRQEMRALFLEMTFVGLDGREKIKVTTSPRMDPALKDVSRRENTYVKAESYFPALQALKPGEIYVSEVVGAYVPSKVIGAYTPKAAQAKGLAFEPEKAGYAGTENPVGTRFKGLIRWATPVVQNGRVAGWVTLALDHDHLMEFTNHILPTSDRYSPIPDPSSGNYAFIWDYKGRSVVHPRHYFITGYDPQTGDPAVPWLDEDLYSRWQNSGKSYAEFASTAPTFLEQSLKKKGSGALVKAGQLGLDCRYLNHAPQCTGWMDLTQHGGSGSFEIFWSGLWKLTTAATIPYYTGAYGHTPRGFGFVTIGANVDDFHRAATEARQQANDVMAEREQDLKARLNEVLVLIDRQLESLAQQLTLSTVLMAVVVIGIAVWMASFLTRRITTVITGIRRFENGELDHRLPVSGQDEMASLNQSFNEMAEQVAESIARLEDAKHRAEEASRMKSEFLANMSHELRTPLNGIIGFAELLRDEAENDESRENAEVIEKSSRHLLELVNSILDVAKIEAGAMQLAIQPLDLAPLVGDVAAVHQGAAAAKNIAFACHVQDEVPLRVLADPTRLRQVLHNFLNNAVKFTQAGQVSLTIGRDGDMVLFQIQDTGPGIAPDMQAVIFEKFRQADNFLTRSQTGTGLGLTLARHLVQMMGGSVGLHSVQGEGSTFHFTLPVAQDEDGQ